MAAVEERAWDMLPAAALVTIFRKLGVEDRFKGGPLVCRSWNEASRNPRCWESMLPEGDCPAFHFIIQNDYDVIFPPENLSVRGIRAFIERSGGRATTLYLSPPDRLSLVNDDTLFFIAERCPKLKHLSLRGCMLNSEAGLLKLVQSCGELELLDLSDACPLSLAVLQEMGRCWPELLGLRRNFLNYGPGEVSAIATSFPKLQLMNLCSTGLSTHDLSTILKSCSCLQFLDVTGTRCSDFYDDKELSNMVARIPEFIYDDLYEGWENNVYFCENDDEVVVYDDFTGQFRVEQFHEDNDDEDDNDDGDELIDRYVRALMFDWDD